MKRYAKFLVCVSVLLALSNPTHAQNGPAPTPPVTKAPAAPSNTFAGIFTCVSVNGIICADQQAGATADVKINNALAALPPNGGTVDARGFGATSQTIAATVNVGSNGGPGKTVTLLIDRTTKFICTITNNTPCWVRNAGSSILGFGTVTNPNAGFTTSARASVSDILLTQDNPGSNLVGGEVDGATVTAPTGAVVSDAICGVRNALQLTQFRNLTCASTGARNTVALKIYCTTGNGCGNIEFDNLQVDCQGNTGCRPVWIGCAPSGSLKLVSCPGIGNIVFLDGVFAHPGTGGIPIFDVESGNGAGGTNPTENFEWVGTQIESSHASDIGILMNGVNSALVSGISSSASGSPGADVIRLAQPSGTTLDGINIIGVDNQGLWTNTVNNTVISDTVSASACGNGCNYRYVKNFSSSASNVWADGTGRIFSISRSGNRGLNIPIVTSVTTRAVATESVAMTGATPSSHCWFSPTNSAAAAGIASVWLSNPEKNAVTIHHTPTAGWTFTIGCTPN